MVKIKQKGIMIIPIISIFVIIIIIINNLPIIQDKLYTGDRIKINLAVNYNGQKISLDNINATCIYQEKNNYIVKSNNGNYSTKGGDYGKYVFRLIIPKKCIDGYENDITIDLNYINTNNWYISNSDCTVNLIYNNNILSGDFTVNTKYNHGTFEEHQSKIELIDNVININWGMQ